VNGSSPPRLALPQQGKPPADGRKICVYARNACGAEEGLLWHPPAMQKSNSNYWHLLPIGVLLVFTAAAQFVPSQERAASSEGPVQHAEVVPGR